MSICLKCNNARKAASDQLQEDGYIGCAYYFRHRQMGQSEYPSFISISDELALGWVDLRAKPFGEKSGITTNYQLLTKGVKKCSQFEPKL